MDNEDVDLANGTGGVGDNKEGNRNGAESIADKRARLHESAFSSVSVVIAIENEDGNFDASSNRVSIHKS